MGKGNYYNRDRSVANRDTAGGLHYAEPHHGMVSEYQQSGFPFVFYKAAGALSGDKLVTLTLPYVSRWVRIKLTSVSDASVTAVRVGFGDYTTTKGIQGANYITADAINAITAPLELKCKKILIFVPNAMNDLVIEVIAGLTGIRQFPNIHGPENAGQDNIVGVNQESAISASSTTHGFEAIYSVAAATAETS